MPRRILDTHVHVWNFDRAAYPWLEGNTTILNKTYEVEELNGEVSKAGVTDGVLVQAANNKEDTSYMLEVAASTDWIKGVVGWVPLLNVEACEKDLEVYRKNKYFRGVRHLIHDEPSPKWLLQEDVLRGLKILADHQLPYDVVGVLPEHIETALVVADKIPSLRMVFDHINQPPIASREKFGRWGELMKEASKHKNFYAKISGLGTTSKKVEWSASDIKPYVEFIFEHFSIDRCFCGGDWPISLLTGSYSRTWKNYQNAIESLLKTNESEKVFYSNGVSFYNL